MCVQEWISIYCHYIAQLQSVFFMGCLCLCCVVYSFFFLLIFPHPKNYPLFFFTLSYLHKTYDFSLKLIVVVERERENFFLFF